MTHRFTNDNFPPFFVTSAQHRQALQALSKVIYPKYYKKAYAVAQKMSFVL
jgi:hypothetical protein